MASLRRLAQENNAAFAPDSPRTSNGSPKLPKTPRNRPSIGVYRSPVSHPSLSASVPFDWVAARSLATPPYGTPQQRAKARKSMAVGPETPRTPRKALIRKKSFWQRMNDLPSTIAFHISMFPQNLPLPSAKTSSRLIAGTAHFLHFAMRISLSWDDTYGEEDEAWIDWSTFITLLLFVLTFTNTAYLFTRTRKYHFMRREEPIRSPNAKFVAKDWTTANARPTPMWRRGLSLIWHAFCFSWRFLLNITPPQQKLTGSSSSQKVQELDVWMPGELELQLFSLYSPVHAFLWLGTSSMNWVVMIFSMGLLTVTLNALIFTFQALVKDKEYIASEVLSEYNDKFVYPRLNPIRHDVGVMTHESEMVNVWES